MLFSPPADIHAEVFAELPDALRRKNQTAPWFVVQRRGLKADSFLEGPCFGPDGALYVTDIPYGRIFRVSVSGAFDVVAEYDGEPNGMKVVSPTRAYIADHKQGLLALEIPSGKVSPHCDRPLLERFKGLNDLTIAPNGDIYFTDQGQSGLQDATGRVYRLAADGTLTCLMGGIPSPNGIVLDPHGEYLLLAVTRANQVWKLPLLVDGSVSKVGAHIVLSGGLGPDGLAIDSKRRVLVCHPGLGTVWVFDAFGEPLYRIRSPKGRMVTNCALHPDDERCVYITDSDTGSILRAVLPE